MTTSMQLTYYRRELAADGFNVAQTVEAIRDRVVTDFAPDGEVELATTFRFRATDKLGRAEPYRFVDPLPDWAVGVLFIAEVEFGASTELAARGLDRPLVLTEGAGSV